MGVLEARENAEKIGYPVVGEEVKDASNVIDYNINEEITKDTSGVINANNQTTTGMATVIPGINAPKLIASTSITGLPEVEEEGSYYGNYDTEGYTPYSTIAGKSSAYLGYYSKDSEDTTLPYTVCERNDKGIVFLRPGGYSVAVTYYGTSQDEYRRSDTLRLNDTNKDSTYRISSATTHTITFNAQKGDVLWCATEYYNGFNEGMTRRAHIRFVVTPK